ncbi:MAG: NfeD family protein, partial [Deltaproteobacteria bacterium]|nr:NfeD family protein [Deltaproteobacteria bacterium]
FYLVFLGVAALLVGVSTGLVEQPVWVQWLSFAALSAVALVGFRRRFWQNMDRRDSDVHDGIVGESGTLSETLAPGAQGQAELRGAVWSVRNVDDITLEAGARVSTVELDGLVLLVRRAS